MERIRARLRRDIYNAARVVAILGADVVGRDAELLNRILRRDEAVSVVRRTISVYTVDDERALITETATDCVVSERNRICARTTSLIANKVAVGRTSGQYAWDKRQ